MFIFSPGEVTGRLGDISVSADMVGINAGMSIMISTYFLMSGKKNVVTLYHITIVFFMSYAIYLTQSRAPLFATAIVIVFVFIFYKSNIPKVGIRLIKPLLIILSIGGVYWLFNNLTEIFFTRNIILGDNIFDTFVKQTTISRIRPMQMVISTSSNFEFINIWFGKGIGYWRDVSRRWGMLRIETFWHESFYELGIIGTLLLFFGYFKIFLFCLKKYFYSYSRNSLMYIMLFLFTLLMSPFSFGWLLYGTPGFIYAFILGSSIISKSTVRSRI
ncbi:MAG: hypothetical protein H8E13_00375 [Actinobacteria bacterium]|nr:hypothetical protein [Actinomycetota bacterium]